MKANSYSEDNVERSGRELAVVRFLDESRDDEWLQTSLTVQGDLGWGQLTSATSYFTRDIKYFQDNTDYTFYLSQNFGANYAQLRPRPGSGRARLERQSERATIRAGDFVCRAPPRS